MLVWLSIVSGLALGAFLVALNLIVRMSRLRVLLEQAEKRSQLLDEVERTASVVQEQLQALQKQTEADNRSREELLDNLEKENEWLQQELERRPQLTRRVYRILTIGMSGVGKTALTLKWANPLFDLGMLKGTKIERYERTVSYAVGKDVVTQHVFEVGDWGGEHLVDAMQEAITEEIHGILIVADLAPPPPPVSEGTPSKPAVDPERIQRQLREFQPEVLKFFFGPRTLASCRTVVLFINKSDLIPGTPAEVERVARGYYAKLIDDLGRYDMQLSVRVLVGSAVSGHSTHHLFAHFVAQILPKNAYDAQLLQRMMAEEHRLSGNPRH